MSLIQIVPPTVLPVTLAEVKAGLRIEDNDSDPLLAGYTAAATEHVEQHLGRALITSTWTYTTDSLPSYGTTIRIPLAPVQSVEQITYVDLVGAEQVLSIATYLVTGLPDQTSIGLMPSQFWPSTSHQPEAITISFTAGYGDSWNDVPEAIRLAITEAVREIYDGCQSGTVSELLWPWRLLPV